MRKKNTLVQGVGVNDYDGLIWVNGKNVDSYQCWNHMLTRCYSAKSQINHPTYIGCSVSEEWLHFSNFKKFYDANYREGFHLDKDILVEGNKIYSPETCVFLPPYLNNLLIDSGNARGDLPLGITANKTKTKNGTTVTYLAKCNNGYGKQLNRTFKTVEEAQVWYSSTKTRIVREQVQRALLEGAIDQRVADALLQRKF